MVRINWLVFLLCLGNLILWAFSGFEEPKESQEKLQEEINSLENELPELETASCWSIRGKAALNEVPAENAKGFINRLQALAKVWKFTLQETAQTGEYPVYVSLSGVGNYRATASLLGEVGRSAAVIANKISLIVQDDLLINAHIEMIVRTGPWKGNNTSKERIEPLQVHSLPLILGKADLFGREAAPQKPVIGTPKIRYLGFYSGKSSPTGIIEENLKSMLVQPGDKTPTGLRIEGITPDFLELQSDNKRGPKWKIPLEKSH